MTQADIQAWPVRDRNGRIIGRGQYPFFIVRDAEGTICGLYQAGKADRLNFRMVYGIARADARTVAGTVEIEDVSRFH